MLALVTEAYGGRGGIAQYNRDLLSALAPSMRIAVLPRLAPDPAQNLPNGLWQGPALLSKFHYAVVSVWSALKSRPQVIFCGHLYMAPLAALAARITGAKLVIQLHGIEGWDAPSASRRKAVEGADLVLCVSRYSRAKLLSWAAIAPERVVVLPNTVGEQFHPGDRAAARARFGFGPEKVILSVGRLDPRERYKGQDRVIAALPELVAQGLDVRYVVAGAGDDRARLEELAAEMRVYNRVVFRGAVPSAELPDLYRAADLFALPSTGEGFGIVFLEAMACGTPALGLARAGALDALTDGIALDRDGPTDMAQGLKQALSTPASASSALSHAARARFGRAGFQQRTRALVARVLGTHS
jgi:phosphatidylinositol alpha-1,6-mannosyltransferase